MKLTSLFVLFSFFKNCYCEKLDSLITIQSLPKENISLNKKNIIIARHILVTHSTTNNIKCKYLDSQLSSSEKKSLETRWNFINKEFCITDLIKETLCASSKQITFKMNRNFPHPGGFDERDFSITFRSEEDITDACLHEEMFHAYQHLIYDLSKFKNVGRSNIEWEAHFAHDLQAQFKGGTSFTIKGTQRRKYEAWLHNITDWGKKWPQNFEEIRTPYFQYLKIFVQQYKEYNYKINYNLTPSALFKIIKKNNCR